MSWPPASRMCAECREVYDAEDFSKNQWSKGVGTSRCKYCVQGSSGPGAERPPSARDNHSCAASVDLSRVFAQGNFRYVYKGTYTEGRRNGTPCVCKVFKTGSVFEDTYFLTDINAVDKALHIIEQWNAQGFINKHIQMNRPTIWSFTGGPHEGQKNLVEPFIDAWQKFNSNSGWASSDGVQWSKVMQALSHYSYHVSSGMFVLCDLQGGIYKHGAILTDPVILSRNRNFGVTDLGPDGIRNFFGYHVCNEFCRHEWTKPRDAAKIFAPKQSTSMEHPRVATRHSRPSMSMPAPIHEDSSSDDDW